MAGYYSRRGEALVRLASFGAGLPDSIEFSDPPSFDLEGKAAEPIRLDGDQYLIAPQGTPISDASRSELKRIGRISAAASLKLSLHPVEPVSVSELIRIGTAKQFDHVSLAVLTTSAASAEAARLCPRSTPSSIDEEIISYASSILGTSGRAFSMHGGACLLAFYTHSTGDAELAATQIARTLRRVLGIDPSWPLPTGPYTSLKLSGSEAEAKIRSFIDGL